MRDATISETAPHASATRRYASVYAAMWKNSVVREMGFKTNFLLWIFVELLWFALQLGFFGVIYSHGPEAQRRQQ